VTTTLPLPKVDDRSPLPLYYQVREAVRQAIRERYQPGDLIPSESELQESFGVSRATIRQALQELVAEGLLQRRRGRGTFVAAPKIAEALPRIVSFSEEMRKQGLVPSTRSVRVEAVPAPTRVVESLGLAADERCLRLERIRCANDRPIVLLVSYLPERLGIDPREDFTGSLYALLEGKYGIQLGEARQVIEAAAADKPVARALEIDEGDPILIIRRGVFSRARAPVEYVEGFYRADRYRYEIRLER